MPNMPLCDHKLDPSVCDACQLDICEQQNAKLHDELMVAQARIGSQEALAEMRRRERNAATDALRALVDMETNRYACGAERHAQFERARLLLQQLDANP